MSILDDLKLQFKIGDVITKLIFWNVILFIIPASVFGILSLFNLKIDYLNYFSLSTNPFDLLVKPWSLISYAFFHSGILHLLFNMMMLHFSGRLFLTFFTQKQLVSLFFVSALFSGILYILSYMFFPALTHQSTTMVGASAAVMAILFATVSYAPLLQIRLLFFGSVKLWHLALLFVVLDLIQLPLNNTGGHLAHLSGALFGYLYVWQIKKGTDVCGWFTAILDFFATQFGRKKRTPFKKVHRTYQTPSQKPSKIITKDKQQQQIDEILDKISLSGYDSLTAEEKDFLFKAGK
jgi:membrane associated rhomboid family serine protease